MSRAKRMEFPGAINLVQISGSAGGQVFFDRAALKGFPRNVRLRARHEQHFESLLWESCEQYRAVVHGYEVEPNDAMLVIETLGAPLSWIMHDLLGRYASYAIAEGRVLKGHQPFPYRYRVQIVEPRKLPYVVRQIHQRPLKAGLCIHRANYPFGSDAIYWGRRERPPCFVIEPTLEALARIGYVGLRGYIEFICQHGTPAIEELLLRKVIGEESFAIEVVELCKMSWPTWSKEELIGAVCAALEFPLNVIYSSTHMGAIARAVVAWCAMRTGTAKLSQVARWFGLTGSDLRYLIRQHQNTKAQFFQRAIEQLLTQSGELGQMPTASAGEEGQTHKQNSLSAHVLLAVPAKAHRSAEYDAGLTQWGSPSSPRSIPPPPYAISTNQRHDRCGEIEAVSGHRRRRQGRVNK